MTRLIALTVASALLLAGCGLAPAGLSSAGTAVRGAEADALSRAPKAKSPFDALQVVSVEGQLLLCPCFTLVAKAGGTRILVDFEGDTGAVTVDRVEVDGVEADQTQRAALGPALEKAAAKMKNKQQAAQVRQVAKAL